MYNFLNLMRTRRLLRASCHQSSFSFSLSLARALAASRYIIATCERSFLNFHLFASIYRIARDFYVNVLYRRRRHFVFIGSFYCVARASKCACCYWVFCEERDSFPLSLAR